MASMSAEERNDLTSQFISLSTTWSERKPLLEALVEKGSVPDLDEFLNAVQPCVPTEEVGADANSVPRQRKAVDVNITGAEPSGSHVNTVSTHMPTMRILVNEMLYFAAVRGKPKIVKFLIEKKGADVHWTEEEQWGTSYFAGCEFIEPVYATPEEKKKRYWFGQTALIMAAKNQNFECVDLLLKAGADVNKEDRCGGAPLIWAAHSGAKECVKALLVAGADVNQTDIYNHTPVFCAAYTGHSQYQQLLREAPDDQKQKVQRPLSLARESDKIECMQLLLESGADVNIPNEQGDTPLTFAAWDSASEFVSLLLEAGAAVNHSDKLGYASLDKAAWQGANGCVKLLLHAGADVNRLDPNGETSVMKSAWSNALECMLLLVNAGADANTADQQGETALMKAARNGSLECLELLVKESLDVDQADNTGSTPLMKAAWKGSSASVKVLLDAGADVRKCNNNGVTPMMNAAWQQSPECVKQLLGAGADVQQATNIGQTALMLAAWKNASECLKLLLAAGADVNHADTGGETSLIKAACQNSSRCVKLLLEAGANLNQADQNGKTALIAAGSEFAQDPASSSQLELQDAALKLLLAAGAEVNMHCYNKPNFRESGANLLFAAGEKHLKVKSQDGQQATQFFPEDWSDQNLKNECRKVIRKHLLTLDPHTNLFMRIPQLQMTPHRAGIPDYLVSYLLYGQDLDVDNE